MTRLREVLVERLIRIYGHENKIVCDFCNLCETFKNDELHDKILVSIVSAHEHHPQVGEEEEEEEYEHPMVFRQRTGEKHGTWVRR